MIKIPEFINKSAVMRRIGITNRGNFGKYVSGKLDMPTKYIDKLIKEGPTMRQELDDFLREVGKLKAK